jgi:hypothetical protein
MYERGVRHFVAVTAVIAIFAYLWIFLRLGYAPIHSDGYSYYVYLPSWVIYRDVTMEALARDWYGGTYPGFTGLLRWPTTGLWVNLHPIGTAFLMAPFFVAGDLLSVWSNLPRDGFSLYYEHAAGAAGIAYLLAGLAMLRRILRRHFSDGVVLATLISITWGTNLFHYGVFDGTFSHVFSFFLICCWILIIERWWELERPTWRLSLALGAIAALIVLIRHTNAIFLLILPLYGVTRWSDLRARVASMWERRTWLGAAMLVGSVSIIPQLLLYRMSTNSWLVSPYSGLDVGFSFGSPHLVGVLFSTQKGLFFWSPLLMFAVVGGIVAKGWSRGIMWPTVVIFGIQTYLAASWWDWQFGGSYGHRAFTDALPLAAVLLAACFQWAARRIAARRVVTAVAAVFVALSTLQMVQYWTGKIPIANTTWEQYTDGLLRFR